MRQEWIRSGKRPLTLADLDETLWPAGIGTIYAIMSPSQKWYIGQTKQALRERWKQHNHPARALGGCRLIAKAFQKYGQSQMELWILEHHVPLNLLNDRERIRIAMHGTFDPNGMGYNLTPGGEQSPMHVQDVAKRSSQTHKRQWQDPEHREKMSKARKSSSKVKAHCEKMRSLRKANATDYWKLPRAKALQLLGVARWSAIRDARKSGRPVPDLSKYDIQIQEHKNRPKDRALTKQNVRTESVKDSKKKSRARTSSKSRPSTSIANTLGEVFDESNW